MAWGSEGSVLALTAGEVSREQKDSDLLSASHVLSEETRGHHGTTERAWNSGQVLLTFLHPKFVICRV